MNIKSMNPKVSIVMPIYNASAFLENSLGKLLKQTLEDIEIICVNDGSTDNSLEMIQSYASNDSRIVIIDKPNGGYGHAVNKGIEIAKGKYIGILEPDDSADIHMYEDLLALAEENDVDVVKSNYYEYNKKSDSSIYFEALHGLKYNTIIAAKDFPDIFYVRPSVWSAIYRREFLKENGIVFNETPGASYQDTGFAFKVWVSANKIVLTDKAYIFYTIDNDNSSVKSSGKIFSVCDEMHGIESFLNQNQTRKKMYSKYLQSVKLDTYYWNLNRISIEYQRYFRDVIGLEFLKAEYDGFLDKDILGETRWKILEPILEAYKTNSEYNQLKYNYEAVVGSHSYKIGSTLMKLPSAVKRLFKK